MFPQSYLTTLAFNFDLENSFSFYLQILQTILGFLILLMCLQCISLIKHTKPVNKMLTVYKNALPDLLCVIVSVECIGFWEYNMSVWRSKHICSQWIKKNS